MVGINVGKIEYSLNKTTKDLPYHSSENRSLHVVFNECFEKIFTFTVQTEVWLI